MSTTHTAFVFAHATNSVAPSEDSTIAFGWSPVGTSPTGASVSASNASTFPPPHNDTKTMPPSREVTQVYGSAGRSTLFSTFPVSMLTATSVCASTRTANSRVPSGRTARPPVKADFTGLGPSGKVRAAVTVPLSKVNSRTALSADE